MEQARVGFYCWAGPNTIDMLKLKFFNPKIDSKSLLSSYDYDYLYEIKDKFGITDVWGMYSWGFSPQREAVQYEFLLEKLENFKKLGIKLHAYIQGTNLVYRDFIHKNWFSLDNKGRLVTYYRGRKVACLNNPEFVEFKLNMVRQMLKYDFDGIFMDNIQMGQIGSLIDNAGSPISFAGCRCTHCQRLFKEEYDLKIPQDLQKSPEVTDLYLKFRADSTSRFLSTIGSEVKAKKKDFGSNSFDPRYGTYYTYGTRLEDTAKAQTYLLFENHSLPGYGKDNSYIDEIAGKTDLPVFVVSYKKGIGFDEEYSQTDIDNLYTEDVSKKFFASIKGSEYFTDKIWHNLYIDKYSKPIINNKLKYSNEKHNPIKGNRLNPLIKYLVKHHFNLLYTFYMENRFIRNALQPIYSRYVAG